MVAGLTALLINVRCVIQIHATTLIPHIRIQTNGALVRLVFSDECAQSLYASLSHLRKKIIKFVHVSNIRFECKVVRNQLRMETKLSHCECVLVDGVKST